MELNAEQIKKALECCVSGYCFKDDCPLAAIDGDYSIGKCTSELAKNALSLINSQEQKNEELSAENKLLNVELGNASSEILRLIDREKELTEENEKLTLTVGAYEVKEALLSSQLDDKCDRCIARDRADTVRKMKEMLKIYFGTYVLGYKIPLNEVLKVINQIAKEILEGCESIE